MDNILLAFLLLLVMIIICKTEKTKREGFVAKPTKEQAVKFGGELMNNRSLLRVGFQETKNKMPWIDAVVYEDARALELKNNLNERTVQKLFQ